MCQMAVGIVGTQEGVKRKQEHSTRMSIYECTCMIYSPTAQVTTKPTNRDRVIMH